MIGQTPTHTEDQSSKLPEQVAEQESGDVAKDDARPKEVGGRGGLDPTRYGDWEKNGRCIDF